MAPCSLASLMFSFGLALTPINVLAATPIGRAEPSDIEAIRSRRQRRANRRGAAMNGLCKEGCACSLRGVDFKLTSEMAFLRNRPQRADDAYRPGYGTVGVRPTASLALKHAPALARCTIPVSITARLVP